MARRLTPRTKSVTVGVFALVVLAVSGCRAPYPADLQSRAGHQIGVGGGLETGTVPAGVAIEDGLTSDEAVALTLWNNAAYHELLAQLDLSTAQLFEAGLIMDPQLVTFFPLGPKQLEFTLAQSTHSGCDQCASARRN